MVVIYEYRFRLLSLLMMWGNVVEMMVWLRVLRKSVSSMLKMMNFLVCRLSSLV